MAYHAGANLIDLDTIQIHPTGDAYPEPLVGILSTEKIRGLGAIPLNKNGDPFVFPLEPRDVESATFIQECKKDRGIVYVETVAWNQKGEDVLKFKRKVLIKKKRDKNE